MGRRPRVRGALRCPHKKGTYRKPEEAFARANLFTGLRGMIFLRGGIVYANLHAHAVITPLRTLAKRCKRLTPLLAAPAALLLTQGQAKAVLTYNIFESGGNLVLETSGSLNLTITRPATKSCGFDGALALTFKVICTGINQPLVNFEISGPSSFSAGTNGFFPADSVSGLSTVLDLNNQLFVIDPTYVPGTAIAGSATFSGKTLADLGITSLGSLGTWTIDSTGETITVNAINSNPAPADVPGPLPLLGAGAAFGWSRRLRKRIATPLITPPQA